MQVTQVDRAINVAGEYVTIDGLDLRYFASRCVGNVNFPEATKNGFQFRNNILAYSGTRDGAG